MAKVQQVTLTPEVSAKIGKWIAAATSLRSVKELEFALRQELVMQAGFDLKKVEGTQTIEIGNGWRLKAGKEQNYSLTNKGGETERLLAAIATDLQRPDIATGLVEWKPDLKKKMYKDELLPLAETNPKVKELLAIALTVKPGAPTLELIPPEEEKKEGASA
jgi:hypothetical protein